MTRIDIMGAFLKQAGVSGIFSEAPLVFWDGYGLDRPYSGVGQYARRLADALKAEAVHPILVGNRVSCQAFNDLPCYPVAGLRRFQKFQELKPIWPQLIGSLVEEIVKQCSKSHPPAILHGLSNFNIPVWPAQRRYRRVLTVHDIIPLLEPKAVSSAYYLQFRSILGRALAVADGIICVSNWTRNSLLERYPFAEGKTCVIQNGLEKFSAPPEGFGADSKLGHAPQFLCVSRYEKYKKLERLIEILELLPKDWRGVLVTDSRGERLLKGSVSNSRRKYPLKVVTGISNDQLKHLYQSSHVYLQPSRFEGFCLPIAEALVTGLPVVFQKGSAIEEIMSEGVGIGLEDHAPNEDWMLAVRNAYEFQESPHWLHTIQGHIATLPTWVSGAQKLKTLYNTFS